MTAREGLRAIAEWAEAGSARYRALFAAIDEGFCVIEVLFDHAGRSNAGFTSRNR